jgi:hypothetical protein
MALSNNNKKSPTRNNSKLPFQKAALRRISARERKEEAEICIEEREREMYLDVL